LDPFLLATGFKDEDIIYVPISGLTGENILKKPDSVCNWYSRKPLLEILDDIELP
jgi:translation elongation factor EF-1alpha